LTLIGSLTTPAFVPTRFETTFFVAHLPPGQEPVIWPGELDAGWWTTPEQMLGQWLRGECLISPPTVMTLEQLSRKAIAGAPGRLSPILDTLARGMLHPIYFAPAVQMIPLRTQALAPSTHTNAFVVGQGPVYLIDPGTPYPEEQERLFQLLDSQQSGPRRLTALILTHHHPDHIGAAAVCAARYRLPVLAHPLTTQALHGKVSVTREIHDGDRLDLGTAPDGAGSWQLEAIHTPGHAPGHLAFYERRYRLLFTGDMVSTLSSIVIAPPEGDLAVYIRSLERLRTFDTRLLLPSHGGASSRPQETLDDCIAHRVKREQELLAALASGPRAIDELAKELYRGLPKPLMKFARLQVQAGLEKLQREGRVESHGSAPARLWSLAT
jgi:glyoxylase-like metal-dependent hydrolase (beta-lactamase superfamily II)